MAYGRLDVFWPDGKFETFPLDAPSISVGRSNGCTIVLETDTISRYHFSITNENGQVNISDMDSANGTFVDGVRLKNNESRALMGGEELQIGHLRMIYHSVDDQPTTPISDIEIDTQRFTREDAGFHIEVFGPEIAVPPGSHTSIEVTIYNHTDESHRYTVRVTGLPEGWARVNRPELIVDGNDNAPVVINIKPFRHSDSTPGDYPVKITVALKNAHKKQIEADIVVRILPFSGFGMALATRRVSANEPFRLHLHNQGSIGLPVYVMGRSRDNTLQFGITHPQIILAPGERHVLKGTVKPARRRLIGATEEHAFDLMVRSRDEAGFLAAVRGYYVDVAMLPRWTGFVLAGLVTTVIAVFLMAVVLILRAPPPDPVITTFQLESDQVVRGEPLRVNWSVLDADLVTIFVDDVPIQEDITPEVTTAEIETGDYSGPITIRLLAISEDRTAESTLAATIIEPLVVDYFEVVPSVLVRNVVQQVRVRWRVVGAITTRVEGLESLGPIAVEPSHGTEGSFEIDGIPTDNFVLTLYAEDGQGRSLEQAVNIDLIDPQCTTTVDNFTLYATPNMAANVVSTVPEEVTLVVDRRDETGAWIRAQLPGGVAAWGARTGLECSNIFNPDNLRIEVFAVEPPTTPGATTITPTPTVPVTPTPGNS